MPAKVWSFERGVPVELVDEKICVVNGVLKLRRLENGKFDRNGIYQTSYAILKNFQASWATEFFGFQAGEMLNNGEIGYQLSSDGGATWQYWNGSSWEEGSGFSSKDECDNHIKEFPFTRELRIKVRLNPSADGRQSPELSWVGLYFELEYDFPEDLHRSLKRYLENSSRVREIYRESIDYEDYIEIPEKYPEPFEPIQVYNLTNDPVRGNNLFQSLSGRTIEFSSTEFGTIEVQYFGKISVMLGADVVYQLASYPVIVVEIPAISEVRTLRTGAQELDWEVSEGKVRKRTAPLRFQASCLVSCYSVRKRETLAMASAVSKCLNTNIAFQSIMSGGIFRVLDITPVTKADRIPEGVFIQQFALEIDGTAYPIQEWDEMYRETHLVKEVVVAVGSAQGSCEEVRLT